MATLWLTYAWADNQRNDVDFVAQQLESAGLTVNLDRWGLQAGHRLWEQIERFILDPAACDAWAIYATTNSLGSEPCKEEYAYALDRAIGTRGGDFPLIAITNGNAIHNSLPAGLRTRLYVSTRDSDWLERVVAAAERRAIRTVRGQIEPFDITFHEPTSPGNPYHIEVRPRAGVMSPFAAAIPTAEQERVQLRFMYGPPGGLLDGACVVGETTVESVDWLQKILTNVEITPTTSCYLICDELPTRLAFGVWGGDRWEGDLRSLRS